MAQSETVKGDVNGDGVVDVADIAAVIKIMAENGDIEKKYYWYVGNETPTINDYNIKCESVTSLDNLPNPHITTKQLMPMIILAPNNVTVKATTAADKGITLSSVATDIEGYSIYKSIMTSAGTKIYFNQ